MTTRMRRPTREVEALDRLPRAPWGERSETSSCPGRWQSCRRHAPLDARVISGSPRDDWRAENMVALYQQAPPRPQPATAPHQVWCVDRRYLGQSEGQWLSSLLSFAGSMLWLANLIGSAHKHGLPQAHSRRHYQPPSAHINCLWAQMHGHGLANVISEQHLGNLRRKGLLPRLKNDPSGDLIGCSASDFAGSAFMGRTPWAHRGEAPRPLIAPGGAVGPRPDSRVR
jgi:hypothetical protein